MSAPVWPRRLYSLDISRCIAAFTVVIWHWQHFSAIGKTRVEMVDRSSQPFYDFLKILYETGTFGYFFLLSGFTFFWVYRSAISERRIKLKDFAVKRLSRLYPLHLLTMFMVLLLQQVYMLSNDHAFIYHLNDFYHFMLNLFFINQWGFESGFSFNGPAWTLSIEVLLYILFFTLAFVRKGNFIVCLIISLSSAALLVIDPPFINRFILRGTASFFLGGALYYVTAYIVSHYYHLRHVIYALAISFWAMAIFSFYVYDLTPMIKQMGILGRVILEGFPHYLLFPTSICALALLEISRGPFLKPFGWFGDITYSVYLLHFPLQLIIAILVSYGLIASDFYLTKMGFILFIAALISISYLMYKYFEMPLQNMLRTRFLAPRVALQPATAVAEAKE